MQYYIPKMLPEYVDVEPDVFQANSDATVAGWRNERRLATIKASTNVQASHRWFCLPTNSRLPRARPCARIW